MPFDSVKGPKEVLELNKNRMWSFIVCFFHSFNADKWFWLKIRIRENQLPFRQIDRSSHSPECSCGLVPISMILYIVFADNLSSFFKLSHIHTSFGCLKGWILFCLYILCTGGSHYVSCIVHDSFLLKNGSTWNPFQLSISIFQTWIRKDFPKLHFCGIRS